MFMHVFHHPLARCVKGQGIKSQSFCKEKKVEPVKNEPFQNRQTKEKRG